MIKKSFILFACSILLVAFTPQEDMELLRSLFENISKESAKASANPEQLFYMSYSLSTYKVDSTEQPVNSTIEVWAKNKLIEIKNPEMQVFQDEKETFVVLPAKHLVLRSDASVKKNMDITGAKTLAMYDSLLHYSRITASEKLKDKDVDKRISIEVNEKGQESFGISKADYYINSTAKTIKKVRIYYTAESAPYIADIAYVDYTINNIVYDYKGKKLNSNVATSFMKDNKLKENYKDYKLIDNRAKAKN